MNTDAFYVMTDFFCKRHLLPFVISYYLHFLFFSYFSFKTIQPFGGLILRLHLHYLRCRRF